MASQNVLQLTQQAGSADTSSVLYAVKGGNTDTGLPLSVLFTAAHLTAPVVTGGSFSGIAITGSTIAGSTIAGGSADNISIGGLTPGAGAFTTLAASGAVTGAGFTTLLAPYGLLSGNLSQFANTTSAQLASKITDETGTGVLVFGTSPTLTTPNLVGTATNNNAAAGSVGEFVTATGTSIALTSTTAINITSISLTAGDWDVWGNIQFGPGTGTSFTQWTGSINSTTGTHASPPFQYAIGVAGTVNFGQTATPPMQRFSLASTTTVFLVATATFSGGTAVGTGFIAARRRR